MHPRPKLTPTEEEFLQAWIWEESHALDGGTGAAKRAQIDHNPYAAPLLGEIVAAAMPTEKQLAIVNGRKPLGSPSWPWATDEELRVRHQEAKDWLENDRFVRHQSVLIQKK